MNHVEEPPPLDPAELAVAEALGNEIGVADSVRDELARIAVAAARPITSAEALYAAASDCLSGDDSDHSVWPLTWMATMLRSRANELRSGEYVDDAQLRKVHQQRVINRRQIIDIAWNAYYTSGGSHRLAVSKAIDAALPFIEAAILKNYTDKRVAELEDRYRRLENIHRLSVEAHRQYVAEHRRTCMHTEQSRLDADIAECGWAELEPTEEGEVETRECTAVPCPPWEMTEVELGPIVSERPADTVETASRLCPPTTCPDEENPT